MTVGQADEEKQMTFAGMNYLAIFVAAIAGWLTGAIYYTVLSRQWMEAQDKTVDECKAQQAALKGTVHFWLPFVLAFLADIVIAWMLAGVIGHLGPGQVTLRNGVISALFIGFGFVVTTMLVNNAFAQRRYALTLIDSGHWLADLVVIGAVIGAFGV
jgi:hypothetical protein